MNPLLLSLVLSTPHVISVPQDHVLPVFGCGTGCRVETEQLALPERMPDGWWRVKVRQSTWIQRCDWDTTHLSASTNYGKAGLPLSRTSGCSLTALESGLPPARTLTAVMPGNSRSSMRKANGRALPSSRPSMPPQSLGGQSCAQQRQ